MNFIIKHISIKNFKSIESIETDLWNNTVVQGDNESAKTTFADAILWTLTGKNIDGTAGFEIVPYGKYGEVNPSVELECLIGEKPVTLKREYQAKFTRDKQFSEYATTTFINGIETGARKFQDWITSNICNEQVFKILSNPKTFLEDCPKNAKELMWQAQRRFLVSIIGGQKTDLEIAESDEKWAELVEPFKRYDDSNQFLTYIKKKYADLQKGLNDFDVRIDQQEKNIVEVEYTEQEIEEKVAELKKRDFDITAQNESYKKSQRTGIAEQIKAQIAELTEKKDSLLKRYNEDMLVYERTLAAYKSELESVKEKYSAGMKQMKEYAEALEKLSKTVVREVCETCGQKLNPTAIQNSKKKLQERIENGKKKTAELRENILKMKEKYDSLQSKIRNIMQPTYPAEVERISDEIQELTAHLFEVAEPGNMEGFEQEKEQLSKEMESLKEAYLILKRNREVQEEIERIEEERKNCVKNLSRAQFLMDLAKEFVSQKCKMYEDSINALFENVTFQLFEKNKSNDEIKETCILRFKGIKYSDLSYSTKIIAALEVIGAFQKFYNVAVPIALDNAESITGTIKNNAQTFLMKVKQEPCPECGGESGRRNQDGTWTCKKCGHIWKKKLEIMEG